MTGVTGCDWIDAHEALCALGAGGTLWASVTCGPYGTLLTGLTSLTGFTLRTRLTTNAWGTSGTLWASVTSGPGFTLLTGLTSHSWGALGTSGTLRAGITSGPGFTLRTS